MANPVAPVEGSGLTIDLLTDAAGTARLKVAVGSNVVTGATDTGGYQGIATHQEAQAGFAFGQPTVVVAGADPSRSVRGLAVDAAGAVQLGGASGTVASSSVSLTSNVAAMLPASALTSRKRVILQASSSNAAATYIGGSNVSETNGFVLQSGEERELPVGTASVYALSAQTGNVVRILEVS
jgi:uncharacterized iron-regulated membrane protein